MIEIRDLDNSALAELVLLDESCFLRPWGLVHIRVELLHDNAIVLGAFRNNNLVGAVFLRFNVDELWLLRIMTHPNLRGCGVASLLMSEAIKKAIDSSVKSLWLEVSEKNEAAIALYHKFGFSDVALRKGYYPSMKLNTPDEDAIVMHRNMGITDAT